GAPRRKEAPGGRRVVPRRRRPPLARIRRVGRHHRVHGRLPGRAPRSRSGVVVRRRRAVAERQGNPMSTAATLRPGQRVDLTLIVDAAYGLGRLSTREHVERRALAAKAPARVSRVRSHTLGDAAFVEVFTDQGTYTLPAG